MSHRTSGQIQTQVLLVLIAILLAVVVGILVGRQLTDSSAVEPSASIHDGHDHADRVVGHDHQAAPDLTPAELALIEGLTCNCQEPGCDFLPLTTCTCDTARAMHRMVKQLVAAGKTRAEIGASLEQVWGDGIYDDSDRPAQ